MKNDLEPVYTIAQRKLNRAILEALQDGPLQYSRLHHVVSQAWPEVVHARTLTRTLRHLESRRLIVHRRDTDSADYRLTTAGIELIDLMAQLGRWTREHRTDECEEDDQ